jgi:hypothetical protein
MENTGINGIIERSVDYILDLKKDLLKNTGNMEPSLYFFDENGVVHMIPNDIKNRMFEEKADFLRMARLSVKLLEKKSGLKIVESIVMQSVYAKAQTKDEEYPEGGLSNDPHAAQAVMVVREREGYMTVTNYEAVYNEDETSAELKTSEPMDHIKITPEDDSHDISSWFIGILYQ